MTFQISRGLSSYSINHSLSFNQLNHSSKTLKEFKNRYLKVYNFILLKARKYVL